MIEVEAKGRINLIGEHIDYNGGLVLPMIIERGVQVRLSDTKDNFLLISSGHETKQWEQDGHLPKITHKGWWNYPLAVLHFLESQNIRIENPIKLEYSSDLPQGAGLSSSAAILVATLKAFNQWFNLSWTPKEIAIFSQQIENQYLGVNCGIMDSYVIAHHLPDTAMLINCHNLTHELTPFLEREDYNLLIINTNVPRALRHSAYNTRRKECEDALAEIQKIMPISTLAAAPLELIMEISTDTLRKRAKHVITEQQRTKDAFIALKQSNAFVLGQLINASHQSLKEDYEVSCMQLDYIVEQMQKQKGCLGARMTGAGFGGCAIALINKEFDMEFLEFLKQNYYNKFQIMPEFYAANGA